MLPKNSIAVTLYTEGTNADTEFLPSIGKQRRAGRTIDASWLNAESTALPVRSSQPRGLCRRSVLLLPENRITKSAAHLFGENCHPADYSGDDICIRFR